MGAMISHVGSSAPASNPSADRRRLRELISRLAVVRGKVTLSSGKEADYYVDLRRVTLHHEASRLVGRVMMQILDDAGIDYVAAGGLTMARGPGGHRDHARGP